MIFAVTYSYYPDHSYYINRINMSTVLDATGSPVSKAAVGAAMIEGTFAHTAPLLCRFVSFECTSRSRTRFFLFIAAMGLGQDVMNMTVQQFWNHYLENSKERMMAIADDLVDTIAIAHKQQREEIRNMQHSRKAQMIAKNKAAKKKAWDVELTITKTLEGNEAHVGASWRLSPRHRPDGMCRIGRSTGENFQGSRGVSLSFDESVSIWHGKVTVVYGVVYYSDLNTRNGSSLNGAAVAADEPVPLGDGDVLTVGDTTLAVKLIPAADEPEDKENNMADA
jgi:hypothetical protein